jgi:hypothetical protein
MAAESVMPSTDSSGFVGFGGLGRHSPQVNLDARWILRTGVEHVVGGKARVQSG